jgi:hypothetical protein
LDGEGFVVDALDTVVVVVQFRAGGCVFAREAECGFDVAGAEGGVPDGGAECTVVLKT